MRRFILVILTLIIIPISIILILTWTTFLTINNPRLIKQTISSRDSYFKLINLIPNYITQKEDDPVIFSKDEKIRLANAAIPEKFAKTTIESIIDSYFGWLNKSQIPIPDINLKSAKDNAKLEVATIYKEHYATLPECTSSELLLQKLQPETSFPSCRIPPESKYKSRLDTFDPSVVSTYAINSLPDKIALPTPEQWRTIPLIFKQINFFLMITTIAIISILTLALYLLFPYKKALLRYLGSIFMIIGLALITIQYFLLGIIQTEVSDSIGFNLSKNIGLKEIVIPIINSLFVYIKNGLNLVGLVMISAGIIFLIACLIVKKGPNPKLKYVDDSRLDIKTKI